MIFIVFYIIVSFCNCASHKVKKTDSFENLLNSIPRWQNLYNSKSGMGEIILLGKGSRFSSYFKFDYNLNSGILNGKLLGSFGMIVGEFIFSSDSISIVDKDGKELEDNTFSFFEEVPVDILPNFIAWDIPISSNSNIIDFEDGWVIVDSDYEVFLSGELLPYKVIIKGNENIVVEYSYFKTTGNVKQPYRIHAKKGDRQVKVELHSIDLK